MRMSRVPHRHLARLLLLVLTASWGSSAFSAEITRYASSEKGFIVNSWLIPTHSGLIVVDTQFTVSDAEQLAQAVQATHLPLKAIVITHPHPDHYNGTCRLLKLAQVPVYATQTTIDAVRTIDDAKRAYWKPIYKDDYPDSTCAPNTAVSPGPFSIDGVSFELRDFGPGEASDESVLLVPALRAAFVGDLVYNDIHPWLAEGRSRSWLAQLEKLIETVPAEWSVYPGHGATGSIDIITAQQKYIKDLQQRVARGLKTSGLSDPAQERIAADLTRKYPAWPLASLVPANVLALEKELSK